MGDDNIFDGDWKPEDAWSFNGVDKDNKRIEIVMSGQQIYDRILFLKDRIEKIQEETKETKDLVKRDFNQDKIMRHLRAITELKMIIGRPEL